MTQSKLASILFLSLAVIGFSAVATQNEKFGNQNDITEFSNDSYAGSSKPDGCPEEGPQRTLHLDNFKPAKFRFKEPQTIVGLQAAEILKRVRENLAHNLPCQISHTEDGLVNNYYIVGVENDGTMTMHRYIENKKNSITKITADDIINYFTDEKTLLSIGTEQANDSGIFSKCIVL